MTKKAFTLIELLLAMVIMSILALLLTNNFVTTLKRGRDAQRKNDLSQIQKALEIYYEDNQSYPKFDILSNINKQFCTTVGCAPTDIKYMIKVPSDPSSSYIYKYVYDPSGTSYYLYSFIENNLDEGAGISISGFTTNIRCNKTDDAQCRYFVSSSNAAILTPNP